MCATELRLAALTALHEYKRERLTEICRFHDEGYSWCDIACRMELSEATVRSIYCNRFKEEEKRNKQQKLFGALKSQAKQYGMVVIPNRKCSKHGIPQPHLDELIYRLEAEAGFGWFGVHCHLGNVMILAKPGITREYVFTHKDEIKPFVWPEGLDRVAES